MSTTYTPDAGNNPSTITLPSDLDPATAESVNAALRALGDKSAFAIATSAAVAALNTFTRGQIINPPTEGEALITSTRIPGAIDTDNKWELAFKFQTETQNHLRMYIGGSHGVGRMAWTINAKWNIDDQMWELDDDDSTAAAIIWRHTDFNVYYADAGSEPFATWPALPATGTGAIRASGEFRYAQSKTRIRTIPLATVAGAYSINGGNGSVGALVTGVQSHIRWPIRVPPGAVLNKISILHKITSSATETFRLVRRHPVWDPEETVTPTEPYLFTVDSDTATGMHVTELSTPGTVVDRDDDLTLVWVPSAVLLNDVHGIRIEWADQGPTPL